MGTKWIPIKEGEELPSISAFVTFERKDKSRFVSEIYNIMGINVRCLKEELKPIAYMPTIAPEPYSK